MVHDADPVRHQERLLLVVRHVHERRPEPALDRFQLKLHLFAQLHVERRQRLVEQQHGRPVHERPRQGDALLLPARQLPRAPALEPVHAHHAQHLVHALAELGLADLAQAKSVGDVPEHGHVREQLVVLEDHVHVAPVRWLVGHVLAAEQDPAASGSSKPASMRSDVVLPQPDGPSSEKNSPSRIPG